MSEPDCLRCQWQDTYRGFEKSGVHRMIVCRTCGNKRCPKATDHRLACTHSNEAGQEGSDYPKWKPEVTDDE